ncbi:hypothetical protein SapgrDRAFT_0241 [Saprospira grandis DSM 2844]|uniref:DUF3299 domain-containing protein n=1 Tax=Saprospira grandis DSM 2844 TaxID=694433 RepID=J0NWW5_9BACT|nr:hypothetical protein [Saprospira grandis]EJF51994.1 hypothetical protein SapgrDRAFT_0241 [Saprospira grandis DSM 2844]
MSKTILWTATGLLTVGLSILFIRPDFLGMAQETTPLAETTIGEKLNENRGGEKKRDADYVDPRRPSLRKTDLEAERQDDGSIVMYAEGYEEDDFSAFEEPENMFEIEGGAAQQSVGGLWDIFLELEFDLGLDQSLEEVIMQPLFTKAIRAYDQQTIEIEGFIIPHDIVAQAMGPGDDGSMFMLSAFPTASCFFCKGAGPESVMEVYPKSPIPYSQGKVKIRGRLELNEFDFLKMAYLLRDAEIVRE